MKKTSAHQPSAKTARFVSGSIMRHVCVMSATGATGLFAVSLVDFLTLVYIAQSGDHRLTAGVGAALFIMFFCRSVNIGLMIAVAALVSRTLGQGKRWEARHIATASVILLSFGAFLISMLVLPFLPILLPLVGATPEIYDPAREYLMISLPSNGIAGLGMGFSAILRAHGEARRSMMVTLTGGAVTAICSPILIFIFKLDVMGAALSTVLSNCTIALTGLYFCLKKLQCLASPRLADIRIFLKPIFVVGLPAIATNLATPVSNAFVARMVAEFGEKSYAAFTIMDRLYPLVFCGFFALSGCIGPILGQNWGAQRFDRMRLALKDATLLCALYVLVMSSFLYLGKDFIIYWFRAEDETAELIRFFCMTCGIFWFFNGLLFCSNASFNNLGFPFMATFFNWGRATLGTIPFAWIGSYYFGVKGIYAGTILGVMLFGACALIMAFRTVEILKERAAGSERK